MYKECRVFVILYSLAQ